LFPARRLFFVCFFFFFGLFLPHRAGGAFFQSGDADARRFAAQAEDAGLARRQDLDADLAAL